MDPIALWDRFRKHICTVESLGLTLDISRMGFDEDFFERMAEPMHKAYLAMDRLEAGALANRDEQRMVGHYWLRAPQRAPTAELAGEIQRVLTDVRRFAADVHNARIRPASS
jgi:glucose-6-phosphate isomerase